MRLNSPHRPVAYRLAVAIAVPLVSLLAVACGATATHQKASGGTATKVAAGVTVTGSPSTAVETTTHRTRTTRPHRGSGGAVTTGTVGTTSTPASTPTTVTTTTV